MSEMPMMMDGMENRQDNKIARVRRRTKSVSGAK